MDWEEYFPTPADTAQAIEERLRADKERINYVNLRYKRFNEKESPWLYDVTISFADDSFTVREKCGESVNLTAEELEYLKLRPFYFATCIGFKAFVLYPYPDNNDNEQSL